MSEADIKEALASKNIVLGSRRVVKLLKAGKVKGVVLAKNCPAELRGKIETGAGLVPVETFSDTGKGLGVFCGKPFPIAAIGILVPEKKGRA